MVENKATKDRFAVKAFSKEYLLGQKKGKESLLNEINIMKELNHEGIMRLYEVHESQNSIYLILELLDGGELMDYIGKNKDKMKVSEYKHIMFSMLKALKYMSSKNIMHRDLKPDNMILKSKCRCGLTQAASRKTHSSWSISASLPTPTKPSTSSNAAALLATSLPKSSTLLQTKTSTILPSVTCFRLVSYST